MQTSDTLQSNTNTKQLRKVIGTEGQIGLIKSVEGLYVDKNNWKEVVDELIQRDVVSIGPMWNFNTELGAAAGNSGTPDDTGLTDLGKRVVSYLDEHNVFIDLSHSSDKTAEAILKMQLQHPAIATHSASRALVDHKRNLPDELAQEIFRLGGVIGMPFVKTFVKGAKSANAEDVVDHIQHFKELGLQSGIVIGTDFDGSYPHNVVNQLEEASTAPKNLAQALRNRDLTQAEIEDVFNGNALRYLVRNLPSTQSLYTGVNTPGI